MSINFNAYLFWISSSITSNTELGQIDDEYSTSCDITHDLVSPDDLRELYNVFADSPVSADALFAPFIQMMTRRTDCYGHFIAGVIGEYNGERGVLRLLPSFAAGGKRGLAFPDEVYNSFCATLPRCATVESYKAVNWQYPATIVTSLKFKFKIQAEGTEGKKEDKAVNMKLEFFPDPEETTATIGTLLYSIATSYDTVKQLCATSSSDSHAELTMALGQYLNTVPKTKENEALRRQGKAVVKGMKKANRED
jgi:hypothetical protein